MALKSAEANELLNLLEGALAIAKVCRPLLDGVQPSDFPAVLSNLCNDDLRDPLIEAIAKLPRSIPDIGNCTINELLELIGVVKDGTEFLSA